MDDQHGDDPARGDSNAEDVQQQSAWSASCKARTDQQRDGQVPRRRDHPGSASRRSRRVVEETDSTGPSRTDRWNEGREKSHGDRDGDDEADRGGRNRRYTCRAEETSTGTIDERRRQPPSDQSDRGGAQRENQVFDEQHHGDEARGTTNRLEGPAATPSSTGWTLLSAAIVSHLVVWGTAQLRLSRAVLANSRTIRS